MPHDEFDDVDDTPRSKRREDAEMMGHSHIHCQDCGYKGFSDDTGNCPNAHCPSNMEHERMGEAEQEREDDEEDDSVYRPCTLCKGPVGIIGKLGNLTHGQCRNCGMTYSWKKDFHEEIDAPEFMIANVIEGENIDEILGSVLSFFGKKQQKTYPVSPQFLATKKQLLANYQKHRGKVAAFATAQRKLIQTNPEKASQVYQRAYLNAMLARRVSDLGARVKGFERQGINVKMKEDFDIHEANKLRHLDVPTQHQIKIAKQTLRMSDVMVGVMGGPNKEQSRAILKKHGFRVNEAGNPFGAPKAFGAGPGGGNAKSFSPKPFASPFKTSTSPFKSGGAGTASPFKSSFGRPATGMKSSTPSPFKTSFKPFSAGTKPTTKIGGVGESSMVELGPLNFGKTTHAGPFAGKEIDKMSQKLRDIGIGPMKDTSSGKGTFKVTGSVKEGISGVAGKPSGVPTALRAMKNHPANLEKYASAIKFATGVKQQKRAAMKATTRGMEDV